MKKRGCGGFFNVIYDVFLELARFICRWSCVSGFYSLAAIVFLSLFAEDHVSATSIYHDSRIRPLRSTIAVLFPRYNILSSYHHPPSLNPSLPQTMHIPKPPCSLPPAPTSPPPIPGSIYHPAPPARAAAQKLRRTWRDRVCRWLSRCRERWRGIGGMCSAGFRLG